MSYKDFPKSVRLNKVIFDITKFVCALLAGLVFEIFLIVLCLDIRIATLIAAYISYKINDMFYYSYIKILIDNTKICYCKKLNIFIKYDEDVNNPLYEALTKNGDLYSSFLLYSLKTPIQYALPIYRRLQVWNGHRA